MGCQRPNPGQPHGRQVPCPLHYLSGPLLCISHISVNSGVSALAVASSSTHELRALFLFSFGGCWKLDPGTHTGKTFPAQLIEHRHQGRTS